MSSVAALVLLLSLTWVSVSADIYLHNPRGSNNRANEGNVQRNSNVRLFNSQNNNRGGYNIGDRTSTANIANNLLNSPDGLYTAADTTTSAVYPMVYYEQSTLQIEWSQNNGCGSRESECNMILQFACDNTHPDPSLAMSTRDGYSTNQVALDGSTPDRGIHESSAWFDECDKRDRNAGLWIGDQSLGGTSARYTRQNSGGGRFGLECSEERDYCNVAPLPVPSHVFVCSVFVWCEDPYWLPTPWMDIAYFTSRFDQFCQINSPATESLFHQKSENVHSRFKCFSATRDPLQLSSYYNQSYCELNGGVWMERHFNLNTTTAAVKPDCLPAWQTVTQEFGHISTGNEAAGGLQWPHYNWTIPSFAQLMNPENALITYGANNDYVKCVLRVRMNISIDDYDPWNTDATRNAGTANPAATSLPVIELGTADTDPLPLATEVSTDVITRVYQDRSHSFYIRKRPVGTEIAPTANPVNWPKIWNLNVRGKRGNAQQLSPAVEVCLLSATPQPSLACVALRCVKYDFIPNRLHLTTTDFLHIQWTGSNTHTNVGSGGDGDSGDSGDGLDGTDRHNFLELFDLTENYPLPLDKFDNENLFANSQCFDPISAAIIPDPTPYNDTSIPYNRRSRTNEDCAVYLATSGYYRNAASVGSASNGNDLLSVTLDNAPASLIGGLLMRVSTPGLYPYVCSRNNKPNIRYQKGVLIVDAP